MNNFTEEQYKYIEKIKTITSEYQTIPKCCIVTFGCQMNAKDSEKLLGILLSCGYEETDDEEIADIVIFNTCTVRENANQRLYGRIGQLKNSAMKNKNKIIGICGCMMQEEDEVLNIKKKYPYVKIIFGTYNIHALAEILYKALTTKEKVYEVLKEPIAIVEDLPIENKFKFKCGINIMYGCNNFCSYCIVPYVRGRERSRNEEDILNEIKFHVKNGVKEIMLLGQNVNSYGNDKNDENINFVNLLKKVVKVEELKRVRFMTSHPKDFSYELIEVIKENDKICKHIHLPIQSGSNDILKSMNRKYTREEYLELVEKIKNNIEDVSITTDIIVGYPNETERDFEDTIDIIKKVEFDSVFTFKYSKRTGTKAAEMAGQVDDSVVTDRFNRLLEVVNEVVGSKSKKYINKIVEVLVEDIEREKDMLVSRTGNNYLVYFKSNKYKIGDFAKVKIVKSHGFYFTGEEV